MIAAGDVVEITNESAFNGMQGEVVTVDSKKEPGYPIEVKMHEKYRYMFGLPLGRDHDYMHLSFTEKELEKRNDWDIELRCYRLFKNMYHRIYIFNSPFNPHNICCIQGCQENNSQRILVNIWGSVGELDVCEQHASQYHGKCVESVPVKK